MRKEVAGFGSSLVLVKLGSGIKPLSPESKDNGPGGQQAVSTTCVFFELLSQTRGLALNCKAGFSSQLHHKGLR